MSENPIDGCFDTTNPVSGVLHRSYDLLKNAGDKSGPWRDIRALHKMNIHFYGTFDGGSVQLYVSNDPDPETSEDDGIAIEAAVSEAKMVTIAGPFRYIRAVSSNAGEDTAINVALHGVA